MTQYKLSPKYFLLTAPTLKASRSLCGNSHSAKFSELVQPNQHEKFCEAAVQPTILQKSPLFSKQIDSVREQLAARTQNTITQTKKNNLLKQLNSVLQGSNLQMEEQSKNWQKKRIQTEKRRRQKEEAAIEQIYQKYNEEVARINALREMANSARTDRVVYSALFKKIQWEIKHYQNIYREIIIRTQANRITKGQKHRQASQELQSADQFQTKEQFAQTAFEYNQSMKTPLFMAQLQKNTQARRSNKVKTRRTHQTQKRLREQAEQVQGKINRIVKTVQCANAKDTIEWYTSIASENAKILTLIDQEQLKIQEIQKEIIRITQARRNSEVIEERLVKKLQTLSSMSKPRTLRQIKTSGDLYEESNADFVANLAKKAGIRLTTGRPLTDVVIELQQRLSRQELLNGERRSASNLQSGVDNILSKMQRFDSCERILNKRQFERQYMRQLSKQKKSQRMRK